MSVGPGLPLSVVVVCHEMGRELPRTLHSLSPAYQGLSPDDYEVIVVDNGSSAPPTLGAFEGLGLRLRIEHTATPTASPVLAMNRGLALAQGALVGAFIFGARMASPGLLRNALRAARCASHPVVASLGFHLGPDMQMRSVPAGYDQQVEDALLAKIAWPEDGYRLFEISCFAGSSAGGWFAPMAESNALFLPRETWESLGGFDPRFQTPGGGLCNLDVYKRACERDGSELIVLLGEGTFHQVHGGIATNHPNPPLDDFRREYAALRGQDYASPETTATYFGQAHPATLGSIAESAGRLSAST